MSSTIRLWFLLNCMPSICSFSQTPISGVINHVVEVTGILPCGKGVDARSTTGFNPGDKVLIIQMKGCRIDESNTIDFGTVLDYGSAGNLEIVRISSITGNQIMFDNPLVHAYYPSEKVQMVRIPVYNDAEITATLTASPWNGSTGGVLILETAGTLTFSADINVSGMGFRGGSVSIDQSISNVLDYFASVVSGRGGTKGEGAVDVSNAMRAARGKLANGGGGGNAHNAGGGGGGNGGPGGNGGKQHNGAPSIDIGGLGGQRMQTLGSHTRVFLGGGGGGGHQNGGRGSNGEHGGGIVIIIASSIDGRSRAISANGLDNLRIAGNDGAGGGGAGGSVLLLVDDFVSPLVVSAKGGKGGSLDNSNNSTQCHGPGGGGGGGVFLVKGLSIPSQVSVDVSPGEAGLNVIYPSPCFNTSYGATRGESGIISAGLNLVESSLQPKVYTVCRDSCVRIGYEIQGGARPFQYVWSPSTSLSSPTDSTPIACPNVTTTYQVTITDRNGCDWLGIVTVDVKPKLTVNIIKAGDTLIASAGYRHQWFLNDVIIPEATLPWIIPVQQGLYRVRVTDQNGCVGDAVYLFDIMFSSTLSLSCTDSVRYDPGEIVRIPVLLTASENLHLTASHEYDLWLHFDKYVMQPIAGPGIAYRDTGRTRIVRISGERDDLLTQGTLIELPAIVTLGDTICTTVHLDSIVWKDPNVVVKIEDSLCVICVKVCEEGGTRLFYSRPRTQIRRTYPNPFNSGTVIEYVLARDADVRLSVFDLYGRAVASLVQEPQAVGEYRLLFDAQRLPSGIYLLTLQTADGVDARLLSLIK